MSYTVTFYALRAGPGEVVVTVHRIEKTALVAYTGAPGLTLAAVRTVKGEWQPEGFRVADETGRIVLDYFDRAGRG